jgi:hypothetical protein
MQIYIRLSENRKSLSGADRWNDFDKKMILKKCWTSLQMNITGEDYIIAYCHDVSNKTYNWLGNNCAGLVHFESVKTIEESFVRPLDDMKKDMINSDPNTLYAYLEDDYLWHPTAFKVLKDASRYWKGLIVPNDAPIQYTNPRQATIYVGLDRYWRSTSYLTWNMMGSASIFKEYLPNIKQSATNRDISHLNKILQKQVCINPIPAVATHCKEGEMSPLVNWWDIWEGINIAHI